MEKQEFVTQIEKTQESLVLSFPLPVYFKKHLDCCAWIHHYSPKKNQSLVFWNDKRYLNLSSASTAMYDHCVQKGLYKLSDKRFRTTSNGRVTLFYFDEDTERWFSLYELQMFRQVIHHQITKKNDKPTRNKRKMAQLDFDQVLAGAAKKRKREEDVEQEERKPVAAHEPMPFIRDLLYIASQPQTFLKNWICWTCRGLSFECNNNHQTTITATTTTKETTDKEEELLN